jgi:hypothetical protein
MYPLSLIKDGEDHRFFRASAEFFIVTPQTLVIGSETNVGYATSNGGADRPLEFALGVPFCGLRAVPVVTSRYTARVVIGAFMQRCLLRALGV